MKSTTRNISLSDELDRFAQADAGAGGFPTMSAYFQDLLRQRRQAQINQDVKMLAKAISGAPEEEPGEAFFRKVSAVQRKIRGEKSRAAA